MSARGDQHEPSDRSRPEQGPEAVTALLQRLVLDADQDGHAPLYDAAYAELRELAGAYFRHQPEDHTLQPTALVHEAFLKVAKIDVDRLGGRTHFFALAAKAMREILVDHARRRGAAKRGGNGQWDRITLSEVAEESGDPLDFEALDHALSRLESLNQRQARVVELRYFAGLTLSEVAEVLQISLRSVQLDWRFARAWLRGELGHHAEPEP